MRTPRRGWTGEPLSDSVPLKAVYDFASLEVVSKPSAGQVRENPCRGSRASNRVLKLLLCGISGAVWVYSCVCEVHGRGRGGFMSLRP